MELNKIKKNKSLFLIATTLCIFLIGLVVFFSNQMKAQADNHAVSGEESRDPASSTLSTKNSDQFMLDKQFLESLSLLNQIKIDSSFFMNKGFKNFKDNTVDIVPVEPGRPNPFAPVGKASPQSFPIVRSKAFSTTPTTPKIPATTNTPTEAVTVITNSPSKIWTKTVDLSGSIINTKTSPSVYFEYGPTAELGSVTPETKPKKDGSFIMNIRALTTKTMYFYRAAAKINDTQTLYGEVVTFSTK